MTAISGSRGVSLNSPETYSSPRGATPRSRVSSPLLPGTGSQRSSPAPASPAAIVKASGLLIPTDRPIRELEERWLPKLGRLRIEKEIVLQGFALYGVRSWYLSRTHWSHTIVTPTGKPTETITMYLVLPDATLDERTGEQELADAVSYLSSANKSSTRKTEFGTLLVNAPAMFGQDVTAIPGGDLRKAKPFVIVNTALRRLGCGGRAAMTLEPPIPTLRRKFHELYKIPIPANTSASANSGTTAVSPTSPASPRWGGSPVRGDISADPAAQQQAADPFTLITTELVKLIQAALALWGLFGRDQEELDIDGLFCDETKNGIFAWRRAMGMEHEGSLKLEKETSGGCIDPKTLSALLSSVTSSRYHLDALGAAEKVSKDPFTHVHHFLHAWHTYQEIMGHIAHRARYLSVSSIRQLIADFLAERSRSGTDALKVHRFLLSGVASATSSLSANLKGGAAEDTPLRKREHHAHFVDQVLAESGGSGVDLIIPDEAVGPVAPPNAITTDLEAYLAGILKSREKDWDAAGARRIGNLWSGYVGSDGHPSHHRWRGSRQASRSGTLVAPQHRARVMSRDYAKEDDGEDSMGGHGGVRSALKGMAGRTEQVLSKGFGLVTRKPTVYETSDSEPGPGPSSLRNSVNLRSRSRVPIVMEPDDIGEDDVPRGRLSVSPSPSAHTQKDANGSLRARPSFLTASRQGSDVRSKRPSIITSFSHDGSDTMSRRSRQSSVDVTGLGGQALAAGATMERTNRANGRRSPLEERWEADRADQQIGLPAVEGPIVPRTAPERALAWRERGRATTMLRTASDGADVMVEEGGMEWDVLEPHGTGRRHNHDRDPWAKAQASMTRRRVADTFTCRGRLILTQAFRYCAAYALVQTDRSVDVELCAAVWELRLREAELATRAKDLEALEAAVFRGSGDLIGVHQTRRATVKRLTVASEALIAQLERLVDDIEDDPQLGDLQRKIRYLLSEETGAASLRFDLEKLQKEWNKVREGNEKRRRDIDTAIDLRPWWKFW